MLVAIRHGRTHANDDGHERLRGWLPFPLTLEGMQSARATAESLAEMKGEVYSVYCSPLVRAVQSAQEVGMVLEMELEPRDELLDWNTGDLAGEEVEPLLPLLHKHIDNPEKKLPGGESYQDFLDRDVPFLTELVESDEICVAVTHNRVITLLWALTKNGGKEPHVPTLKMKAPIEPSGIMLVSKDWKILYQSPKDEEKAP